MFERNDQMTGHHLVIQRSVRLYSIHAGRIRSVQLPINSASGQSLAEHHYAITGDCCTANHQEFKIGEVAEMHEPRIGNSCTAKGQRFKIPEVGKMHESVISDLCTAKHQHFKIRQVGKTPNAIIGDDL